MGRIRASLVHANPRFDLVGIVDPLPQTLSALYQVESYTTLSEAVDSQRLHGVIVSSPTSTHTPLIQLASDHNLAVFTEKPVAATAEEIESLFAYADNIPLCCGFQRRFDPSYVAAAQANVGVPVYAHLFFADHPMPPKEFLVQGGNIFMDLSAHDVDYIRNVLQDEVVSVYAKGTCSDPELGVEDNATMVLHFRRGTVATLFLSRGATYGYDQRCEIFGDQGHVSIGNVPEHTAVVSNATGIHHARLQHSFPERFQEAFRLEMEAFASTILDGVPWPVTEDDCVQVQRVADAARLSSETGQVVVVDEMK